MTGALGLLVDNCWFTDAGNVMSLIADTELRR